jgi:hypothetical protein
MSPCQEYSIGSGQTPMPLWKKMRALPEVFHALFAVLVGILKTHVD